MAAKNPMNDPNAPLAGGSPMGMGSGLFGGTARAGVVEVPEGEPPVDQSLDMSTNALHKGVGQTCPYCSHVIQAGQAVRRTVSGAYQHDVC